MAKFHEVNSFDEFNKVLSSLKDEKVPIFVEFFGAHDSSGKSWCPDCVKAEPVVEDVMKKDAPSNAHFLHVSVGNRSEWRDPQNSFRCDDRLKLTCIPTLILWGSSHKLLEKDCADKQKVVALISEKCS